MLAGLADRSSVRSLYLSIRLPSIDLFDSIRYDMIRYDMTRHDTIQYNPICWLVWPIVRLPVRSNFPFTFTRSIYLTRYDMIFFRCDTIQYDTICWLAWAIVRLLVRYIILFLGSLFGVDLALAFAIGFSISSPCDGSSSGSSRS